MNLILDKRGYGITSIYYSVERQKFVLFSELTFSTAESCKKMKETFLKNGWNNSYIDDNDFIQYFMT